MRKRILLFQIVSILVMATGFLGAVFGDTYDNITAEEKPVKHPPLTKYQKSEYISKSLDPNGPYIYTEDGDPIVPGVKPKKSKAKHTKHKQATAAQKKKALKKMDVNDSDKTEQTQATTTPPAQAAPSEGQTTPPDTQAPSVKVMP